MSCRVASFGTAEPISSSYRKAARNLKPCLCKLQTGSGVQVQPTSQQRNNSCSTHLRRAPSSRSSGASALGWHSGPSGSRAAALLDADLTYQPADKQVRVLFTSLAQ